MKHLSNIKSDELPSGQLLYICFSFSSVGHFCYICFLGFVIRFLNWQSELEFELTISVISYLADYIVIVVIKCV